MSFGRSAGVPSAPGNACARTLRLLVPQRGFEIGERSDEGFAVRRLDRDSCSYCIEIAPRLDSWKVTHGIPHEIALGEVTERLNAAVLNSPAAIPMRHRKHG
jgi:hypothetical protein